MATRAHMSLTRAFGCVQLRNYGKGCLEGLLREALVLRLSAQIVLNIAVACGRLNCDRRLLAQLRDEVAAVFVLPAGGLGLSRLDRRQWAELQHLV